MPAALCRSWIIEGKHRVFEWKGDAMSGFTPYSDLTEEQQALARSESERDRARAADMGWGSNVLVSDPSPIVREHVARAGDFLDTLVSDPAWFVRSAVAKQGHNLATLAADPEPMVRRAVAAQASHLDELVHDPDYIVRSAVAKLSPAAVGARGATPGEAARLAADQAARLTALADDADHRVRWDVALQGFALDKLIDDPDLDVSNDAFNYLSAAGYSETARDVELWAAEHPAMAALEHDDSAVQPRGNTALHRLRREAGYRFAADFAAEIGIPARAYGQWERTAGSLWTLIPAQTATAIADKLGCGIEQVMEAEDPELDGPETFESAAEIGNAILGRTAEPVEQPEPDELYFYNASAQSVIGIWDFDGDEPGWYWERYQMDGDGTWRDVDGGLWTREYDDEGNLVDGYATCREAYEDACAYEGDAPCSPDLFNVVKDCFDGQCEARFKAREAGTIDKPREFTEKELWQAHSQWQHDADLGFVDAHEDRVWGALEGKGIELAEREVDELFERIADGYRDNIDKVLAKFGDVVCIELDRAIESAIASMVRIPVASRPRQAERGQISQELAGEEQPGKERTADLDGIPQGSLVVELPDGYAVAEPQGEPGGYPGIRTSLYGKDGAFLSDISLFEHRGPDAAQGHGPDYALHTWELGHEEESREYAASFGSDDVAQLAAMAQRADAMLNETAPEREAGENRAEHGALAAKYDQAAALNAARSGMEDKAMHKGKGDVEL